MDAKPKKKILISGAGVAGILCALLLDKEKYNINLIERAPSFRNIGFSITLWKTRCDQTANRKSVSFPGLYTFFHHREQIQARFSFFCPRNFSWENHRAQDKETCLL
ncbi:MAG: hypothetical protein V4665_03505 [Patescibacteria group bacterium]